MPMLMSGHHFDARQVAQLMSRPPLSPIIHKTYNVSHRGGSSMTMQHIPDRALSQGAWASPSRAYSAHPRLAVPLIFELID